MSARNDYKEFLLESNLTEQDVQQVTHSSEVMDIGGDKFVVARSDIEGLGLFSFAVIKSGDVIGPALSEGNKTEAGRYTNHSGNPNAKMVVVDRNNINLVAITDIGDEEITTDYRENLRVQGLKRIS